MQAMTLEAVRWGILSTARVNRHVIPPAKTSPKIDLIAVASRTLERAATYAADWDIPRAYGSYEALLDDRDVEAVYISLPNSMHCEWSIRAAEAGKHVLCEKPVGSRSDEVRRAFDAADSAGTFLMEAFMWRHSPQTASLRKLIDAGAIGQLRLIRSCFSYGLYDNANIRLRTDLLGGALMDVGCYCVNASRFLAGEPDVVFGQQKIGPTGTDWVFTALLHFPDGVLATFDCGTALPRRDELEAIGSDGSLFLDDPWHCRHTVIDLRKDSFVESIEVAHIDPYGLQLENLSDAIRGRGQPRLGRTDAVAQARVIESLIRSVESGQAFEI